MDISKKDFEHSEKTTFQSNNEDDYSSDEGLQNFLRQTEGVIQIVIPYKDDQDNERYYSKSYYNDPEDIEFMSDYELQNWIDEMIDNTLDMFGDDADTYGASETGTASVVVSAAI